MYAYELLPRLTHLTLTGQDEDGLEFVGDMKHWQLAGRMDEKMMLVESPDQK